MTNMVRNALSCFILLSIFGHQVSSLDKNFYTLENAIDDLNTFIPGSKLVLTSAIKLWLVYNEVSALVHPNMTVIDQHLEEMSSALMDISSELKEISQKLDVVSGDVKETNELIREKLVDVLPKYKRTQETIEKIMSHIHKINYIFEQAFTIKNIGYEKHENKTLADMVDSIIGSGTNSLPILLHEIYELILDNDSKDKFLDRLSQKNIAFSMMCERKESAHHEIKRLYQLVMVAEMKNLLMSQLAYSVSNMLNNKTNGYITERQTAINQFAKRTSRMSAAFKNAMNKSPRDFWKCDPDEHAEGSTYAKLSPVFQAYIMNEKDSGLTLYDKRHSRCGDTCEDHDETRDLCRSTHCRKYQKKCSGLVRDCKSSAETLNICLADIDSDRRYDSVEVLSSNKDKEFYGKRQSCPNNHAVTLQSKIRLVYRCDYCICTCEDINDKMGRYFSLKNVTSDLKNNYVVTGVRFAKQNNIFHIQIQQGKLVNDGFIHESTVEWKPVDNFTVFDKNAKLHRDYYNISWNERTVNLDTLDAPSNNVLTGLRFQLDGESLKLEIHITPFNFSTGKLEMYKSKWVSNSANERTEIDLTKRDIGTSTTRNSNDKGNERSNASFKFTISSLESDIGQNVVPFIDLQKLQSSPFVLLSGAGLILRNTRESAGFLSFKLLTYNYALHMKSEV